MTITIALPSKGRMKDDASAIFEKAGMKTITIYGTHHILYTAIGVLLGITDFSSTPLVPGLIMLLGVAILEVPIIYAINRWAPWLAGKHRRIRPRENQAAQ